MSEYIKQNFTKGQTLKADHLNYMEDGIAGVAERTKGMPYVEKMEGVFEFNGDATEYETFDWQGNNLVIVSDKFLSKEELIGSTITMKARSGMSIVGIISENNIQEESSDDYNIIAVHDVEFSAEGQSEILPGLVVLSASNPLNQAGAEIP